MEVIKIKKLIDETICSLWQNEINKDYNNGWLLKEDTLKAAFYFHLRNKLGCVFDQNNIRIFTEFTEINFKGTNKRPDMVIAQINEANQPFDCLAVIEFKFKSGFSPVNDIYDDFTKLKFYVNELKLDCRLFMITIWEYCDSSPLHWERKNSAWAKNKLIELNASYDKYNNIIFHAPYPH